MSAFFIQGDTARQRGGNRHFLLQHLLGALRIADFVDPAWLVELHALLAHLGLKVDDTDHSELVRLHSILKALADCVNGPVRGLGM